MIDLMPTKEADPGRCPSCNGTSSPRTHSAILGWECSDCRIARLGRAPESSPAHGLRGQPAVNARREAGSK